MSPEAKQIGKSTLVSLGMLAGVVLASVGGTWAIGNEFRDSDKLQAERDKQLALRLQKIETTLAHVQVLAENGSADRWHRSDMIRFARRLRELNEGTMKVPEIDK